MLRQIADLQRQAGELQNRITQGSHDIAGGRGATDELRQGLEVVRAETDTLRRQRQAEEDALARDTAREKQRAAANPPRRPPAPRPVSPPLGPASTGPSAAQQLLNAQQWLAAGKPDEARRILAMAQTQMELRTVRRDHPIPEGGSLSSTDMAAAIHWLDMGAYGQAMQAIGRAINHANAAEPPPRPWSGYPNQPPSGGYGR